MSGVPPDAVSRRAMESGFARTAVLRTSISITAGIGRVVSAAGLALLVACAQLPERQPTADVYALPRSQSGPLESLAAELSDTLEEGESAYWLVEESKEALDTRLAMFDSSVSSLDVQYFIWEDDASSRLLMRRLVHSADRGVRVRLLMDDVSVSGRDDEYQALDSHPSIEVRLFNPWRLRSKIARVPEFLLRFRTLNHRLHNKTIIADGHLALIGGRNIGDRYFGLYDVFVQNDLDILFAGPMVERVIDDFDRYWNASESFDVNTHVRRDHGLTYEDFARSLDTVVEENRDLLRQFPLAPADWSGWRAGLLGDHSVGRGEYLFDLPGIATVPPTQLYSDFMEFIRRANEELIISTAYFVPDDELLAELASLVAQNVRVIVLTNSLQTNNHTTAHVAYKRWRRRVLDAGVELYELQPDAHLLDSYSVSPAEPGFLGLHSKAVIVDERWSFVGTPNVDPRSLLLNTENGVVVDSEELSGELRSLILETIRPVNSWRVAYDDRGRITWTGNPSTERRQPANGFAQRIVEFFVNLLPIKKQT
jgi:putative cardiolipin synthase